MVSHVGLNVRVFNTYILLLWHPTARNCEVGDHETDVTPRPDDAGYGLKLHKIRPSGAKTITLQHGITHAMANARGDAHEASASARQTCTPTRSPTLQSCYRLATNSTRCSRVWAAACVSLEPNPRHCKKWISNRRSPVAKERGKRGSKGGKRARCCAPCAQQRQGMSRRE